LWRFAARIQAAASEAFCQDCSWSAPGLTALIVLEISNAPAGDVALLQTRAATAIAHTPWHADYDEDRRPYPCRREPNPSLHLRQPRQEFRQGQVMSMITDVLPRPA